MFFCQDKKAGKGLPRQSLARSETAASSWSGQVQLNTIHPESD